MRIYEGWPAQWCEPKCAIQCFPSGVWALWELLGYCLVPIPTGMSVVWKIGIEEFSFFIKRCGDKLTQDDEDYVLDLLRLLLTEWESNKSEWSSVDENDIAFMQKVGELNESWTDII